MVDVLLEKFVERSNEPGFADCVSYEMYEKWATDELLRPDDLRHYRRKNIEEYTEFLAAEDRTNIVEEAGDFIWTLTTGYRMARNTLGLGEKEAEFAPASMESVAAAWDFSAFTTDELADWIRSSSYLFQRKLKLTLWVGDTATEEIKRDYILNVLEGLAPRLIAAAATYTKARTGSGIDEILRTNVNKLHARKLQGTLDKAIRQSLER
jgi:hypothetical protein